MPYKIGEKVAFLHEVGGGVITKIKGETYFIEDETGFDRPFLQKDIAKIHSTNFSISEAEISEFTKVADKATGPKQQSKIIRKHKDYWEIDLHFDDIVDEFGGKMKLNKEQALTKQLQVFRDFYYKAREKKMRKLIVIHGFGLGILREEIQIFLKGQDGVDFHDASYMEYGHGAIQVEIKYNY